MIQHNPARAVHDCPLTSPLPLSTKTFLGEHTTLFHKHVSNVNYEHGCRAPKLQCRTHTAPCIPLAPPTG